VQAGEDKREHEQRQLQLEHVRAPELEVRGHHGTGHDRESECDDAGDPEATCHGAHRIVVCLPPQSRADRDHEQQLPADEEGDRQDVQEADDRPGSESSAAVEP